MLIAERYSVVKRLGAGGMASVFLADDEHLQRRVALKRVHPELDPDLARRFKREAKLGASLNHANVVKVYDVIPEDDSVTLVMEYVEGETLAERLKRGPMAPDDALAVLAPLADALDHAHAMGVIHRDVKPANVLLREDGLVKLADLGIATGADVTRVTRTGTALGSLAYMAPEQLNSGAEVTPAVDVYGLALLAFEMLSGRKARTGSTPGEMVRQADGEPPDLRDAWPDAPPGAVDVLRRAMAPDPRERPHSAEQLVFDLRRSLGRGAGPPPGPAPAVAAAAPVARDPTPPPAPAPPPPPAASAPGEGRSRRPVVALAVLLLGLCIAGVLLLAGGDDGGNDSSGRQADRQRAERQHSAASANGKDASGAPAATATSAGGSPADAVTTFYKSAAAGDIDAAWALATPGFRSQLGGYDSFRAQQSTLRSIRFRRSDVTSASADAATVTVETTAVHSDGTENCAGDVQLVRSGSSWLLDRIAIDCRT